jgi:transglutaminase-like putative cysteine protease
MATNLSRDSALLSEEERPAWPIRFVYWFERWARPYLGWGVLFACMALAALPAVAVRANRWLALGAIQTVLELAGPLAVLAVWGLWGWRSPVTRTPWSGVIRWLLVMVLGAAVISQLLLGWIPSPAAIWREGVAGNWPALGADVMGEWSGLATRVALWWEGVRAGGAAQDNLVFALAGSLLLLLAGSMVAWLARRTQQGYAAAAPALWLLGTLLLYSSGGKYLLITGLALAVLLQLLLDQEVLTQRWQALQLDYSPGLLVDRMLTVFSAAVLVLTVATVMPNLFYRPLVMRYYQAMAPINEGMESFLERLFPDVRATSRLRGSGLGGLPNEFLLQGGPQVTGTEVMRVRTNESGTYLAPYEEVAPPGHYMRGGTLTDYSGKGWSNPDERLRVEVTADEPWQQEQPWGRKLVVQSVILEIGSQVIYAAPEPIELSTNARLEERLPGDAVGLFSRERSYTVVSAVPAVDEEILRGLRAWGEGSPLPEGYEIHLALPDTVTERTRALAEEVTAGRTTMYDKAAAIEEYLRQYEYDLGVPPPPANVEDVADYFLFDLQRGYCDYYATAFVVLGRMIGLPTRFATGFAVGTWNPVESVWVVTEAEAHSWPEVYFPQVGWVPFEPTAGRPTLTRIASPQFGVAGAVAGQPLPPPPMPEAPRTWDWQTVLWLGPLALAVWGLWALASLWRKQSEDPWQAVIKWGRRTGRPMNEGETVLEYGGGLADYVLSRWQREPDAGRIVAREVRAISGEVSTVHYGPEAGKPAAAKRVAVHWERIRPYLKRW